MATKIDSSATPQEFLSEVILRNPGCKAIIDNDSWTLQDKDGNTIATPDTIIPVGDGGYGSGPTYGGDIMQALAQIVGVEIESV